MLPAILHFLSSVRNDDEATANVSLTSGKSNSISLTPILLPYYIKKTGIEQFLFSYYLPYFVINAQILREYSIGSLIAKPSINKA